ncbi:MAG: acyl-CoA dehydrogenase family protein, partial [Desulfobacterales bacterium]
GWEALRQTVEYTKLRKQGGGPLAKQQFIRFTLADMETRLEAARLMTYSAADLIDKGKPFDLECSIAKLFATETVTWCCERALHLHGAYGYMMESDIQRFYRDCKVLEFGEGTSEIQREIISGFLLR